MRQKFYTESRDVEYWNNDELHEAVINRIDSDDLIKDGDIISVYSGDCIYVKASELVPNIFEQMIECAFDNHHEDSAERFEGCMTVNDERAFQDYIEKAIDDYFDKHNLQPDWGNIENIEEIKVKVIDADNFEYEVLSADNQ